MGKNVVIIPFVSQLNATMYGMAEGGIISGRYAHPIGPKEAP